MEKKSCEIISNKEKNYFTVNLPLVEVDNNGKFIFPYGTNKVMIDIGTSFSWPNSTLWSRRNPNNSIVLGFEPDINMWASHRSAHHIAETSLYVVDKIHSDVMESERQSRKSMWSDDSGEYKRREYNKKVLDNVLEDTTEYFDKNYLDKVIFFPVAIGSNNGYSKFNVNDGHGRSSMLDSFVHKQLNKNLVPVIRLYEILKRIPDNIKYIDHLKVDAQGYDFEVIKSADDLIKMCVVVTVEVGGMYEYTGGYNDRDMLNYIISKGFTIIEGLNRNCGCVSFINEKYKDKLNEIDCLLRV